MAGKTVERRPAAEAGPPQAAGQSHVDPRDEPSVDWGWHGRFPKLTRAYAVVIAVVLLALLVGNHEHNTENVWLIGLALGVFGLLALDLRRRRTAWRK